jgi:predicted transposase YdaD
MRQKTTEGKKVKKKPAVRFDRLWKDLLESFFYAALEVFYPALYQVADRDRKPIFLDKELRIPGARKGQKILDLLVEVPLKTGGSAGVLLHVELQGEIRGEPFQVRMYKYSCLIVLRMGRPFIALAIRTTPKKKSEELRYEFQYFESKISYDYRTVFIDQMGEDRLLAMTDNPLAVAVVVASRMLKAGKSEVRRFEYGREMVRLLKTRGYPLEVRHKVGQFIEGVADLRAERLLEEFEKEIADLFGEVASMPLKTPIMEKVLKRKSYEWGRTEGILEGILEGETRGKLEGKRETARSMLADGMAPDLIAKFTGLSVREVQDLRAQG